LFKKSSFFGFLLHYYTQLQFQNFHFFSSTHFHFFTKFEAFLLFNNTHITIFSIRMCHWVVAEASYSEFSHHLLVWWFLFFLCVFGYHEIWINESSCVWLSSKKLNLIVAIIKLLLKFKSSMTWFKCSISSMCSRNLMFGFYEWILRMKLIFELLEWMVILFCINIKQSFPISCFQLTCWYECSKAYLTLEDWFAWIVSFFLLIGFMLILLYID